MCEKLKSDGQVGGYWISLAIVITAQMDMVGIEIKREV